MKPNLLLDMDDTLLANNMDVFGPAYFKALSKFLSPHIEPLKMIAALKNGTDAMTDNNDPSLTLEHAFDRVFYPQIGIAKAEIHPVINRFYEEIFPTLQVYTAPIPGAVELVENALNRGITVSIATNPLFPLTAIEQRLCWANLDPQKYPFALVPGYETFHFAKPNPSFYTEYASRLNVPVSDCWMVGNDREMDILPSIEAGMKAYLIDSNPFPVNNGYKSGPLQGVIDWVGA